MKNDFGVVIDQTSKEENIREYLVALSFRLRVFLRKNGLHFHHLDYPHSFYHFQINNFNQHLQFYPFLFFLFSILIFNYLRVFLNINLFNFC
jgi:hypothetical protein